LYAKGTFGSATIKDPALFLPELPNPREHALLYQDGQLVLQAWYSYNSLVDRNNLPQGKHIGYFNLQKQLSFDVDKLGREIGVDFAIYHNAGHLIHGDVFADGLADHPSGTEQYRTLFDRNNNHIAFKILVIIELQ